MWVARRIRPREHRDVAGIATTVQVDLHRPRVGQHRIAAARGPLPAPARVGFEAYQARIDALALDRDHAQRQRREAGVASDARRGYRCLAARLADPQPAVGAPRDDAPVRGINRRARIDATGQPQWRGLRTQAPQAPARAHGDPARGLGWPQLRDGLRQSQRCHVPCHRLRTQHGRSAHQRRSQTAAPRDERHVPHQRSTRGPSQVPSAPASTMPAVYQTPMKAGDVSRHDSA